MVDVDTFLTILYVMVDDFCQSRPQTEQHPGPDVSLSPSEVLTLAIFARWARFGSERDFYRYANTRLRDAFPTLPHRLQFNRCVRDHLDLIEEVALHLVEVMKAQRCPYEALDSSAMPIRDAKRRGPDTLTSQERTTLHYAEERQGPEHKANQHGYRILETPQSTPER